MGVTELVNSSKRIEYSGFRVCIVVSINRVPITKRIAQKNRKFDHFDLMGYGLQFTYHPFSYFRFDSNKFLAFNSILEPQATTFTCFHCAELLQSLTTKNKTRQITCMLLTTEK